MTLEEAIKHAEEKAKYGGQCGEDHAQLAEWLKELKERRAAELEKRTEERTETHACDCISRQAAIDTLTSGVILVTNNNVDAVKKVMELFIDKIKNLPPAEPERKTGKWLPDNRPGGGFWVCSCCKFPSEAFAANVLYKFCPNCGARMEKWRSRNDNR